MSIVCNIYEEDECTQSFVRKSQGKGHHLGDLNIILMFTVCVSHLCDTALIDHPHCI